MDEQTPLLSLVGEKIGDCLYGENAYQVPAQQFASETDDALALHRFEVVAGQDPSYNTLCAVDRMVKTITHIAASFDVNRGQVPLIAVAVKHGNACGAAVGTDGVEVLEKMVAGDSIAILGGLVITNFAIGEPEAETLLTYHMSKGQRRLLDAIVAPKFNAVAIETLRRKKDKCRFMVNRALEFLTMDSLDKAPLLRQVRGGFLMQPNYRCFDLNDPHLVRMSNNCEITDRMVDTMLLVKGVNETSNSNSVTGGIDRMLIGNGVGQQDRLECSRLWIEKAKRAGHDVRGSVSVSDSFYPFDDGPRYQIEQGVHWLFSTSGSIHDQDTIDLCKQKHVALWMIPDKVGRGFFGH